MADDQKSKTMDINDLVRELSKSSTNPMTPSSPPAPQGSRPPFPMSKPSMPPPMAGSPTVPLVPTTPKPPIPTTPITPSVPRPQFNVPLPPKPVLTPRSPVPGPSTPPTPGVKEYQSSIRTMNEDISRLKQGQKPAGVDIPRKVEQTVPVSPPMPPKPIMPSPQFKVPSVNLGESQKTGSLTQSKDIPKPPIVPKIEPKPQIYIPESGQKGNNRNTLFMIIGAVAVVAGFSYWFFVLRSSTPEVVVETPTLTPAATATSISLAQIFGLPTQITVPMTGVFLIDFTKKIEQPNWPAGRFTALNITDENENKYPISKLMEIFSATPDLLANLDQQEWATTAFGQTEKFDEKGTLILAENPIGRLVILTKVTNSDLLRSALDPWEAFFNEETKKISQQLKDLGLPNPFASGSEIFLGNMYKGVNIRYRNLFYPDKSVDYAIVSLPKYGTEYFFIANSRESAYAIIDFLQNQ